ncbi:hypothetical protein ABZ721_11950 [Streptomyces sp. NPDC006733]|uniref:hypothetical protein n=1 Tax=Streptomyces sp. NPDC006733 TaxID=3155460 RepID=UPI0033FE182B
MKQKVNIIVVVDVIGALSGGTLRNGNLCMIDDGSLQSAGQGTADLVTIVAPGQTVQWTVLAVDLQTPVEIKNIEFLEPGHNGSSAPHTSTPSEESEKLELDVWSGVVPRYMTPGVAHKYRLELQMYEGAYSVLDIDTPALMCQ